MGIFKIINDGLQTQGVCHYRIFHSCPISRNSIFLSKYIRIQWIFHIYSDVVLKTFLGTRNYKNNYGILIASGYFSFQKMAQNVSGHDFQQCQSHSIVYYLSTPRRRRCAGDTAQAIPHRRYRTGDTAQSKPRSRYRAVDTAQSIPRS